jgi:hypothetical protein
MKTILIVTSLKSKHDTEDEKRLSYVQDFCDAVEAKLANVRVCFTTYDDIVVTVLDNVVRIYDNRNKLDVLTADFVHFKNWINDTQTAV